MATEFLKKNDQIELLPTTSIEVDAVVDADFKVKRRRLAGYTETLEARSVHRYEFAWREGVEPALGSRRVRLWWVAQMISMPRLWRKRRKSLRSSGTINSR